MNAAWQFYMELAENSVTLGHLAEAEDLFKKAVQEAQVEDPNGPGLRASLQGLAMVHCYQRKYRTAAEIYVRALRVSQESFGPDHPETAAILSDLAWSYENIGRLDDAEQLYNHALTILETALGVEDVAMVKVLHGLS